MVGVSKTGVKQIRLTNFRSYNAMNLVLDGVLEPVILTGHNGAGKTNVLEAVSFLTAGKGLRSARLADEAKRTGDAATLGSIKNSITLTVAMRRRAQRMLHAIRLFSTKADQMEGYKDFCGVLSEVSSAMGNTISAADVAKAQQDLQMGIQNAQSADQLMDQMLGTLDASFGEMVSIEESASGLKSSAIDDMIAKLAGEKDNATENRIEELLQKI